MGGLLLIFSPRILSLLMLRGAIDHFVVILPIVVVCFSLNIDLE